MFEQAPTSEMHRTAERLCGLVAGLDLGSVVPGTAKDLVALGERIERCGRTLKTMAAAKVAASPAWQGEGDRTAEDWLARTTGSSKKDAESTVETGKRLERLPATADAARRGELSAKQAEAIAGAASADPAAEARLLDAAKAKSRIMQRILVNDAEIRHLAEPWLQDLDDTLAGRRQVLH